MGTKLERVIVLGNPSAAAEEMPGMASAAPDPPAGPGERGSSGNAQDQPARDRGSSGRAEGQPDREPDLLTERRGHILIVTMNRPQARNALSGPMLALLRAAWDTADSDPGIRACILTGAGGAFCAGADLKAMIRSPPGDSLSGGRFDVSRIDALLKGRRLVKPLIAAVEGPAIAGGTEILQACDVRVAGTSARFGISEARWGLFPLGGSAVRLARQIPYTLAAELLLTGRHITADEALRLGLIGHVVPDGHALAKAIEIAELIAANGPLAVQAILRTIRETEGLPEHQAFAIEAKIGIEVFASADAKEGPRAFADKRPPVFRGK
jgi:enoyl-CoA hydratase